MEEEDGYDVGEEILRAAEAKEDCKLDLRGMELKAYSNAMDAFRADGALDKEKRTMMESLKKYFHISEARHIAEIRRVNSNDKLSQMAECLEDREPEEEDESWGIDAYDTFPTLPPLHRRSMGAREPFTKQADPPPNQPVLCLGYKNIELILPPTIDSGSTSAFYRDSLAGILGEDSKLAKFKWDNRVVKASRKVQTKVSTIKNNKHKGKFEFDSDDDNEVDLDNVKQEPHERSPDIIDAASPHKNNKTTSRGVVTRTTRGPKRRLSMENKNKDKDANTNGVHAPTKNKNTPKSKPKTVAVNKVPKKLNHKINKPGKTKGQFPKIKFAKRRPPTPEPNDGDGSSEDERDKDNKTTTSTDAVVNTEPSTQEVGAATHSSIFETPPSVGNSARGRNLQRGRGSGSTTRGRGGGPRGTRIITPTMNFVRNSEASSPSTSESLSPIKCPPKMSSAKLKVSKPKKPKPVSISRRKSRLKEKEDDDMQMEWDDYDDEDNIIMSNKHGHLKRRKMGTEDPGQHTGSEGEVGNSHKLLENGESSRHNNHHYLSPPSEVFHRLEIPPHRSPNLSGEETDSASEKGSTTQSPGNNSNATSPPPTRQKQRKTPLNPQLPRINIPPPVFSTSLSSVQKKRTQKNISVVDSLNLHLPTTPTASSLASSSRRPTMGLGIFSNSQAMIAQARGSPGILQNQRKATPHILSNSKAIQRSYNVPNPPITSGNSPVGNTPICLGVVTAGGATISLANNPINSGNPGPVNTGVHQVQTNVIPNISSASVMQISNSSTTPLSMSTGIPIGNIPRAPGPGPIIFLQKANSNPNVPTSTIGLTTSNTVPVVKPSSRAVILRRTQLPRSQGNVMILDMQNKPIISNQFIQPVSRIITAPSDVLNIQSGQPQKITQLPSDTTVVYSLPPSSASSSSQRKQKFGTNQNIVPTNFSDVNLDNNDTRHYQEQGDNQIQQIEAELLEMEQGVVYEEEVVTSSEGPDTDNVQNETAYSTRVNQGKTTMQVTQNNLSPVHRTPENRHNSIEVSLIQQQDVRQMSDALTRAICKPSLIPGEKDTNDFSTSEGDNAQNNFQVSQNMMVNQQDDIFQTALKASGIQFFDVEEMCSDNQSMVPVSIANHLIVENQENGSNIQ